MGGMGEEKTVREAQVPLKRKSGIGSSDNAKQGALDRRRSVLTGAFMY